LELAKAVAVEVASVANAHGIDVQIESVYRMIALACEEHGDHIPSMSQDLISKRRTEVDSLNGAVVVMAEKCGIPAPVNSMLATLVRLAEVSQVNSR